MKNILRATIVLLVLTITGSSPAQTKFGGPGPGPICGPDGCGPGMVFSASNF